MNLTVTNSELNLGAREQINWITLITLATFHSLAVVALFHISWSAVAVAAILHWLCTGCGIGMGYHRLHTHRSYKVPRVVEHALAILATMALQGGPIFWTAIHRLHHRYSDQKGDPHSPRDGKWWAHMLWIVRGKALHSNTIAVGEFAPDLMKDRFYRVLSIWHWVPLALLGIILFAVGGWSWLLWGVFFRVVVGLHSTWLVNSVCHLRGTRRFETSDTSRNCSWVALLTFGEGWHNNHHAQPTVAKFGFVWWEIDLLGTQITLLERLGLAWDVKRPQKKLRCLS